MNRSKLNGGGAFALILAALLVCAASGARGQDYPNRALKFLVPAAAGTAADRYSRLVAQRLSEVFKQPVVVENKPGAGGSIGTEAGVNAPADGYTLLYGSIATIATNPHHYKKLSYDTLTDLVPGVGMARGYLYLFVPVNSPANSVSDCVRIVKANPGKYDYGSSGNGTPHHIAMELFKSRTGIDIQHVPYKGGTTQVVTDAIEKSVINCR